MANKQVVGLFESMDEAQRAVQALRDAGFAGNDISLVANNTRARVYGGETATGGETDTTEAAEGAGAGATAGTILGGLTGLLVGLGALVIPGVGPVIAAGSIATALGSAALGAGIGAASGGLLGALVGAGIPEEDANIYAEGVRRGGALVTVQADDANAERAADLMDQYGVVDIDQRSSEYRQGGWSRFDANAPVETTGTGGTSGAAHESATAAYDDSSKVGTVGGGAAGAMTGAAIGAVGGPVGAAIGGVAGALVGGTGGAVADTAGKEVQDHAAGTTGSAGDTTPSGTATDFRPSDAPGRVTQDVTTAGSGTHESATEAYDDSSKVGTVGGGAAGAMTGAAMGAVAGPVGAAIGGVAGALVGGTGGAVADTAGKEVQDHATGTAGRADYSTPSSTTTDYRPSDTTGSSSADYSASAAPRSTGSDIGGSGTHESATEAYDDSSKVGTVGGGAAGAMTGAAIGAVGGPVGAAIGGVAGALAGGTGGAVADTAGKEVQDHATGTTGSGAAMTGSSLSGDPARMGSATGGTGSLQSDYSTGGPTGSAHDYTTRQIDAGSSAGGDELELDRPGHSTASSGGTGLFSPLPGASSSGSYTASSDTPSGGTHESATEAYDDSSKVGTVGGGAAGAMTGAAMGAVGGPVGALIGGVAGALVGGTGGAVADTAGKEAEDHTTGGTHGDNRSEPGYTGRTGTAGHASDSRGSGEPTTGSMGSDTLDDGGLLGNSPIDQDIRRATDSDLDPRNPGNNI